MGSSSSSSIFLGLFSAIFLLSYLTNANAPTRGNTTQTYYHTLHINSLRPSSLCNLSSVANKGASLGVIHRYGPCSHLGQEKTIMAASDILNRDMYRLAFFSSRRRNKLRPASGINLPAKGGNLADGNFYTVTVGLGTPVRNISLAFDTGSDLTWTQCKPCAKHCYKQKQPIFDPSESVTYSNVTCGSELCRLLNSTTVHPRHCSGSTCEYLKVYADDSHSAGNFAKERLTLSTTDVSDGFLFGCGQENARFSGTISGLLGLSSGSLSIVSQTATTYGKQFSYCLPSPSGSTGHLTFGRGGGPTAGVKFTPIKNDPDRSNVEFASLYYINITSIIVGRRRLAIDPSVFNERGTIVDSGTAATFLPSAPHKALRSAFREQMKNYPLTRGDSRLDTCYDLRNYTTATIPKVGFVFEGNVEVDIDVSGILIPDDSDGDKSRYCLAFIGNNYSDDVAVLGSLAQQTFEVVYDVAGGKMGFGARGCA